MESIFVPHTWILVRFNDERLYTLLPVAEGATKHIMLSIRDDKFSIIM